MFSTRTVTVLLLVSLLLLFLVTACGASEPQVVEKVVTKEVEVEKVVEKEVEVEVVVTATPEAAQAGDGPILITWWSHFADQPSKRAMIERLVADYEAEHPDVDIVLTWWDKNPLRAAIRSTMTAGKGAPDITTFDTEVIEWVEAGWLLDLTDALPWENFIPGTELDGTYPDQGYPGVYKFNIGFSVFMLFYNPDIFEELGIEVPEDRQFTEQEFLDVVQKCNDAGYAGVSDAIGNRPYPGVYPVQYALFNLVGAEEFQKYESGKQSWDTPEARKALEYSVQLRDAGLWPDTFTTMTLDETHAYFHTQHQACMFYIPSWYTGRAFKAVEEGGQDPNWHFGMLRYPKMDGCQACDTIWVGYESGYGVLSSTPYPEVSKDILAHFSQPKYGALWTALTNIPSAVVYDQEQDWPTPELLDELGFEAGKWDWYWAEFDKAYGSLPTGLAISARCGDFNDAVVSALNEGLPLDLVTVDEAVEMLDSNLCQ
ncbi:MAG: extracellular solute-binding protein [Planctomycetota bacterium]|nr:MAG: extracellular solute-binding protein [Planctomycetota bacterium]